MNAILPKDDAAGRERLAWLRLARSDGVGAVTFVRLLERFGSAERALAALPELKKRASWSLGKTATTPEVTAELAALAKLGAALLTRADPAYPERLRHIPDPPPVLAVRGDADLLRGPSVAIIGARNASANGCVLARRIAADLARAGIVVVSGLARGIDTAAHEGALQAGGTTVAAVAGGVDTVYPPENEDLMARIVQAGAVVSERPPRAGGRGQDLPRPHPVIPRPSPGGVGGEGPPPTRPPPPPPAPRAAGGGGG